MYWSVYVLDLYKQGHSVQDIVDQVNLPLVTENYVKKVITFYKRSYNKFVARRRIIKRQSDPKPNTKRFLVKQYIDQIGVDKFWEEYKTSHAPAIAAKLGVDAAIVKEYVTSVLRGRKSQPDYYKHKGSYHSVLIEEGKMQPKIKTKQKTVKDVLDLW